MNADVAIGVVAGVAVALVTESGMAAHVEFPGDICLNDRSDPSEQRPTALVEF